MKKGEDNMLNKNELIDKYASAYDIHKTEAKKNIDEVIDMIQRAVIEDGGVDFYGFMKIEKAHKDESTARNPLSGEKVVVAAKDVPKAKFSSRFKKAVNGEV